MSKKTLIWLGVAAVIIVTVIILYIRNKKAKETEILTKSTGSPNVTTTTTGNTGVSTSTGAGNVSGGPVYEVGWDGLTVGDPIENISGANLIMTGFARLCEPPTLNDSLNKVVGKSTIGQCGIFSAPVLSLNNYPAEYSIPQGGFGNINYIDSSIIQIRTNRPLTVSSGTVSDTIYNAVKFITIDRAKFNANYFGKIGVKKI